MHSLTISIPSDLRREVDDFLKEKNPSQAITVELRISKKNGKEGNEPFKAIQILLHKPAQTVIGVFYVSHTGEFFKAVPAWENLILPEVTHWESTILLIREAVISASRQHKVPLDKLAIEYEVPKIIRIQSIRPFTWGVQKLYGMYKVER